MQVTKIHRNIMGTVSFTAKFKGMRKEQEFIVYPNPTGELKIQSETRCAVVNFDGSVRVSNVKYFMQMTLANTNDDVIENIEELKEAIRKTAGDSVGTRGIVSNNSLAATI